MGYNDDGIVKVDQEFLEPFDRREIQVVGRLIEEQDVRVSKKCLSKKDFDLLASGQVCHLCVMKIGINAKSVQKSSSIRFCFPSVHLCEFALEFTGTDSVLICKIFFSVDRFFFFHDLVQSGISHDDGVENLISVIFEVVLLQERKTLARSDNDISVGRLKLSGQDLEESRLTGTVCTDQTITVSLCEFDVDILKESFLANTQCDIIC